MENNEKQIFENAGKAIVWLDENENLWNRDEKGFYVLKINDAPEYVIDTIKRLNGGIVEKQKRNILEEKMEGR